LEDGIKLVKEIFEVSLANVFRDAPNINLEHVCRWSLVSTAVISSW
jgi:hypothetical protein